MFMPSIIEKDFFGNDLFKNDLFDNFFEDFAFPTVRSIRPVANQMRTDIKESDNAYTLAIDLPGYSKEEVKAKLRDGYLTISATKDEANDEKDESGNYIRRERYSGSMSRSFFVGKDVKDEDIKASFENGILSIEVPKIEKPKIEDKYMAIN